MLHAISVPYITRETVAVLNIKDGNVVSTCLDSQLVT